MPPQGGATRQAGRSNRNSCPNVGPSPRGGKSANRRACPCPAVPPPPSASAPSCSGPSSPRSPPPAATCPRSSCSRSRSASAALRARRCGFSARRDEKPASTLAGLAARGRRPLRLSRCLFHRAPQRAVVEAGLINYFWPLLIVLFSAFLPGEKLKWQHLPGCALALIGAVLVVTGGRGFAFDPAYLGGYLAALAPPSSGRSIPSCRAASRMCPERRHHRLLPCDSATRGDRPFRHRAHDLARRRPPMGRIIALGFGPLASRSTSGTSA